MNKVIVFNAKSALGSFNRPQSNNNPSTFYIMPKSALIGMIAAVIGLDREFMKTNNLYKVLSDKLKYCIKLRSPFKIKYHSEYGYNHANQGNGRPINTPSKSERLVDINYDIYVMYDDNDADVNALLQNFVDNIKTKSFVFPPYMGMANFHVDINYINTYDSQPCNGRFTTSGICTNIIANDEQPYANIRTDDIPTQNIAYLGHDNKSYKTIYFHDSCGSLEAEGNYYLIDQEALEFI